MPRCDQTIALKRDYRDAEALALARTNRGKSLMDEANIFFAGIISATDKHLTTGVAEQKTNASLLRLFSIISGIVIVARDRHRRGHYIMHCTRRTTAARETEVSLLNADLEQRMEAAATDLARANGEIQHFVQIISHDLRPPLVTIVGFTGELPGRRSGEPAACSWTGPIPAAEATNQCCRKHVPPPPNCYPKRSDTFAPRLRRWSG